MLTMPSYWRPREVVFSPSAVAAWGGGASWAVEREAGRRAAAAAQRKRREGFMEKGWQCGRAERRHSTPWRRQVNLKVPRCGFRGGKVFIGKGVRLCGKLRCAE